MPTHDIIDNRKQKLVDHINRILSSTEAAKRRGPEADTSEWEREIDQQVYALYGLTPEEIRIVEESSH